MFEYRARCVNVVDGDTQDVIVDLGFHIQREIRLRLTGVDTHETYGVSHDTEEYRRGAEETAFVEGWVEDAQTEADAEWPLIVRTAKTGKYGRYLATIERQSDRAVLNDDLQDEFDGVEA